jgi:glycosyltransferase involved in cell wall biosynthesis
MKKINIFALVEGNLIDNLSDRLSGTFIRIHYILKYLKKHKDIKLIYIPYNYKQKYSDTYSRINWCIDIFYHLTIPFLSLLIIIFRHPHFLYFSYPNVIINDKFNIFLLRFSKKIGIKLIMYSHDWIEQSTVSDWGYNKFISENLEKELVRLSDVLIVVLSKYPEHETMILPGGLEEKEFANLNYKIHQDRFNIAYIGSMSKDKGIDILIDAAIKLQKSYPKIKLLLFGNIFSLDNKTKEKIKQNNFIEHKVVPRNNLISFFSNVDVFAYPYNPNIPYWNNTRPTKFFEYIGSEIPFISTKCVGLRMITEGKGLLWVDYSQEDFFKKLEYLLKNPKERIRLSSELHVLKKDNTWGRRANTLHKIIVEHFAK